MIAVAQKTQRRERRINQLVQGHTVHSRAGVQTWSVYSSSEVTKPNAGGVQTENWRRGDPAGVAGAVANLAHRSPCQEAFPLNLQQQTQDSGTAAATGKPRGAQCLSWLLLQTAGLRGDMMSERLLTCSPGSCSLLLLPLRDTLRTVVLL